VGRGDEVGYGPFGTSNNKIKGGLMFT